MKLNKRKGFTIVELVIVIAVIAILAAVLIPNISNLVKKANASADESLVRNLNTALSMDVEKHQTMDAALEAAKTNGGYDLTTIVTKNKDNKILWDSKNDCFVYLNGNTIKYLPNTQTEKNVEDVDYFEIVELKDGKVPDSKYSAYLAGESVLETVEVKRGLDVGKNTVAEVVFKTTDSVSVLINTNGGKLTVDAGSANVTHRGDASIVTIKEVYDKSYHENGKVNEIKLEKGRVVVEAKAEVGSILVTAAAATGVKVEVKDSATLGAIGAEKFDIKATNDIITGADKTEVVAGATGVSGFAGGFGTEKAPYLIADLQGFKNISSNSGKYFKMIADVDLGVLTKDLLSSFRGTFDGNGHALTVKNSTTSGKSVITSATNATFKNLKINTQNVSLVAYGYGLTYFDNVDISGEYATESSNNESAYIYHFFGTELRFENCDASYNLEGDGWQAVFLGGYVDKAGDVNVIFKNLTYSGHAISKQVAMLAGNGSRWIADSNRIEKIHLTVENCVNKGTIISTDSSSVGTLFCSNNAYAVDAVQLSNQEGGSCLKLALLENVTVTLNSEGNKIVFNVANEQVAKVVVKAYTRVDMVSKTDKNDAGNGNYYVLIQEYTDFSDLKLDAKFAAMEEIDNAYNINNTEIVNLNPNNADYNNTIAGTTGTAKVTYDIFFYGADGSVIGYDSIVVKPY